MKYLFMAVASLFATTTFAQDYEFELVKDDMSGNTYYFADPLIKTDEDSNKGFKLELLYYPNTGKANNLYVKHLGLSNCSDEDQLIIMFEDGSRIFKRSYYSFNCEGKAMFHLTKKEVKKLKSMAISKVRVTSGNTFSSFTVELEEEEKTYLIQLYVSLNQILNNTN